MTDEEVAALDAKVPEATDIEIARVFCMYSLWSFEPTYYECAKVALVAAKARGLTLADLRRLAAKDRDDTNAEIEREIDEKAAAQKKVRAKR